MLAAALGLALALGGALVMMVMSWGVRAGAVPLTPMLAMVFTLTAPAGQRTAADAAGLAGRGCGVIRAAGSRDGRG